MDLPTHLPNSAPPAKKHKGPPVFIEGTSITLQTEEDIAKWIEERRKNWPTRKNVEAKAKDTAPQPCAFFQKTGKCKFGNRCKNAHSSGKIVNGVEISVPQRYKEPAVGLLFRLLVQRDMQQHENNAILDFLLHLDKCGLLDRNALV